MPLDQTLGAADPTYDPQSIVTGLIGQQAPDLVQGGTVDPQAVLNRLIRKGLSRSSTSSQPTDFSSFGKTSQELGPNASPNGETPDFASFGEPAPNPQAPNPQFTGGGQGTAESPYTGDVPTQAPEQGAAAGAAEAAVAAPIGMTGQALKYAARAAGPAADLENEAMATMVGAPTPAPTPPAEESPLYKAGEATQQFAKSVGPSEATKQAHPIATGIGGGIGGAAGAIALGLADPIAGLAGTAALFGASSAEDTFEDAKKHGADDQTASGAALLSGAANAALGTLPIGNVLKPFEKIMPQAAGLGVKILAQAAQNGVVFASVGEAQEYIGQQIAKMYDPKAGYSPDVERLISEFATGAVLGGLHAGLAGRGEASETAAQPAQSGENRQNPPGTQGLPPPGEAGAATGAGPEPQAPPGTGGAGAQAGSEGAQPGAGTDQQGAAKAQPEPPPPPFETQLNPRIRSVLEDKAAYYKEFSPEIIASWSDDKLKNYVNQKFGFGSQRTDDDEILRRYGVPPADAAAMSPEQKSATVDEALRNGVHAGQPAQGAEGTAANPVDLKTSDDVAAAASMASQGHTAAQGEAGNVQKGHATWNGLDLSIEVPPGGVRTGTVKGTGEPWQTTHPHAYGEILGVPNAADGMRPDVIVGDHPDAPNAYVVDELDARTGQYKQSKALVGFQSPEEAKASYLGISSKSPEQVAAIETFPAAQFPDLVRKGLLSGPVAGKGSSADHNNVSGTGEPVPPTHADHEAIETSLRQVGVDPKHIRPVDIQRAAEIHAQEGYSPEDSFQLAVARAAVEDGLLTPEQVKQNYGPDIAALLVAPGSSERRIRPQASSSSTRGPAAAGANERIPGGGANGTHGHGENAENAPSGERDGNADAGVAGKAGTAGHPEAGTADLQRTAGGERNAAGVGKPAGGEHGAEHEPAVAAENAERDTGEGRSNLTVPEADKTLDLQQQALVAGRRQAQMFPVGTKELPLPKGMERIETASGDVFHFNPKKISADTVRKASAKGTENRILGLGPYSKADILKRVQQGEKPVAVTERTPDGTEVRAAAGTDQTAATQMASMERTKTPGNTIEIEHPAQTIAERNENNSVGGMPFAGMLENNEKYRQNSKKRRESGLGSNTVYKSHSQEAARHGLTGAEAKAQHEAATAANTKKLNAALKTATIARDSIPDDVYEAAVGYMHGLAFEPLDALDYAMLKAEHEAQWDESEDARSAAEHIFDREEGPNAGDVAIPPEDERASARVGDEDEARHEATTGGEVGVSQRPDGAGARGAAGPGPNAGPANEHRTESTSAGQQHVIPGAEPISGAELAKRRSEQSLKPKVAQKSADEGLFSDESKQADLVDQARAAKPPPETELPTKSATAEKAPETGPSSSEVTKPAKRTKKEPTGYAAGANEPRSFIDLGKFETAPDAQIGREAQAYVIERGRETGLEHLVAFDKDGSVVAHGHGTENGVQPSTALKQALLDPNRSIVVHHNHPTNTSLSAGDIGMLGFPGQAAIWAHGDDGVVSRGALTAAAHKRLSSLPTAERKRTLTQVVAAVDHVLLNAIGSAIERGAVPLDEANAAIAHIVATALSRAGILDYRSNIDASDFIARAGLEPFLARAARLAARNLLNAGPDYRDDGRPAALQHPGDLGATFGRTRTPAEWDALQEGRHQEGDAAYRVAQSPPHNPREVEREPGAESEPERSREEGDEPSGYRENAHPFYSAVARAVENVKQEKASPNQWLGMLNNAPGVKSEEMEWLGLPDWLKEQKSAVTKQQVADYIRANEIEVQEVEHGGIERFGADEARRRLMYGEAVYAEGAETPLGPDAHLLAGGRYTAKSETTKFKQYTLPGGENYRELLLTLPPGERTVEQVAQEIYENFGRRGDGQTWEQLAPDSRAEYMERAQKNFESFKVQPATYKSSHWDEPNVLAHIRFDDRTTSDDGTSYTPPKRTLHVAEIQSDWHQAGRKKGYESRPQQYEGRPIEEIDRDLDALQEEHGARPGYDPNDAWANAADLKPRYDALMDERYRAQEARGDFAGRGAAVPDAPFKSTWPELSLKRIIRYAAENGYDRLSWDSGETNADRYDLSKQISRVVAEKLPDGRYTIEMFAKGGDPHGFKTAMDADKLPDYVGKELAEKIVSDIQRPGGKTYSGLDLKVGGEGMRAFYDKILPAAANKLVKKFGAKVGEARLPEGSAGEVYEREGGPFLGNARNREQVDAARAEGKFVKLDAKGAPVHSIDITPALRDAAVRQGFALFEHAPNRPTPSAESSPLLAAKIGGSFRPFPGARLGAQAQNYVLARGRATGNEHVVGIHRNGGIALQAEGGPNGISFGPRETELFANPANDTVVHHNHPNNGAFSIQDLSMLGAPGMHSLWAHGHAGNISRVAPTALGRKIFQGADFTRNVERMGRFAQAVGQSQFAKPLLRLIDSGRIDAKRADSLYLHMIAEALRRAGLVDYHTSNGFENDIASLGLDHYIDSAARAVIRSTLNGNTNQASPGHDRRTGTLFEHPGDLGAAFERAGSPAAAHGGTPIPDRLRQTNDRAQPQGAVSLAEDNSARTAAGGAGGGRPPPPGSRTAAAAPPPPGRGSLNAITDAHVAKQFKNFWASTFQPELFSDKALEADPLFARYKARQQQEKDSIVAQSESEWNYWNKRSDAERIRFLDDIETGATPADPKQAAMARRYRAMLDKNWELEKQYGSRASFVEDYFPHIWEHPQEWEAFAQTQSAQVGPTWFQKKRTFDYIKEGLAAGLKLRYTNPVDIVVHRLLSGVDMRQRMDLLYRLKEMGLAWEGKQGGDQLVKRGWRAINAPDRKQWVLAPDVQLLWKNGVEAKGLWQAEHVGGSIFRGWMTIKNAWVPIKLALSAFHPLHVLHIDQANTLALAWDDLAKNHDLPGALTRAAEGIGTLPTLGMIHYRRGAEARAAWQKRPSQQTPEEKAIVDSMAEGGFVPQLSEQLKIGAKKQLAIAWQKVQRGEAGVSDWRRVISSIMRRPIEKLQAPIFEKWIPALKAAAYLAQDAQMMQRHPEYLDDPVARRIARRAIAKSIDNRYGEMNYGTLFWNRTVKDGAIGSFLSLGWNLGFLREFGGATMEGVTRPAGLLDPFAPSEGRKISREATNKIAFALAYVGTAALINGIMTALFTGEEPKGLDYIFARIGGQNPDGSPRRITNMFYLREVPMLLKHIQERGGNILTGAGEMLWNKLMFEPFHELLQNRDYYGYNIWDENAPIYKQVWQGLSHTFRDQLDPMSVSGAKHAAELSGKPFPADPVAHPEETAESAGAKGVGLSLLGFGPAPAYVEKSALQNRIAYLYDQHVAPVSRPEEQGENTEAKMGVRQAILIARRDHDSTALSQAYAQGKDAGLSQRSMNQVGRQATDIYLFSRLPNEDQLAILHQADKAERDRYWPKAHPAVKMQIMPALRQMQQVQ